MLSFIPFDMLFVYNTLLVYFLNAIIYIANQLVQAWPLDKKVGKYSKGIKVKFNFALALATNPKFLILDEDTSGLDPLMRDDILNILMEYVQKKEHIVLFSSHIVSDLDKIADKIIFIHKGKVILEENKYTMLYNYGIIKCSFNDFQEINPENIITYRKLDYETMILVEDKKKMQNMYPNLLIESPYTIILGIFSIGVLSFLTQFHYALTVQVICR